MPEVPHDQANLQAAANLSINALLAASESDEPAAAEDGEDGTITNS